MDEKEKREQKIREWAVETAMRYTWASSDVDKLMELARKLERYVTDKVEPR